LDVCQFEYLVKYAFWRVSIWLFSMRILHQKCRKKHSFYFYK